MTQGNNHTRQIERDWMVDTQIVAGGVTDQAVDRGHAPGSPAPVYA